MIRIAISVEAIAWTLPLASVGYEDKIDCFIYCGNLVSGQHLKLVP